jgi:hypothetical protein
MFKDTCLIAHKRIDQSPHMFELEILVYLILKSSYVGSGTNSPYAQAYSHINATIISIGIDLIGRGYDSENFGARIT